MKLSEIFTQLSIGELSNLQLGNAGSGIIKENYSKVVGHVNLALAELHKRFLLKIGSLTIDLQDGQTLYPIKSLYQVGNYEGKRFVQFIQKTDPLFNDSIIKIEQVFDEKNRELGLNDGGRYSISTPDLFTLRVPAGLAEYYGTKTLTLNFRANHDQIVWEDKSFDPEDVEVNLPYSHMEALLYYIASRVHNPVGFNQDQHEGNNYYKKFLNACDVLSGENIRVEAHEVIDKNRRGGWA